MRRNGRLYTLLPSSSGLPLPSWRAQVLSYLVRVVLPVALALNILLGWTIVFRTSPPQRGDNSLDDYQALKPELVVTVSPSVVSPPSSRAIVSTLLNDQYTIPVATLGHSLTTSNATSRRILMYIAGRLSEESLCTVRSVGWELHPVLPIAPPRDGEGINPRFVDVYTKLNLWTLDAIGVETAVFIDGDTLVRQSFEELFELPFVFGAVPDVYEHEGFTTQINSGVLLARPSSATFNQMMSVLETARFPPSSGDQAFLDAFFSGEALRLPYVYNANLAIKKRSPELWRRMQDAVKIVHYTTPAPFEKAPREGILGNEDVEKSIKRAKDGSWGEYREEIGWWEEAWRDMERMNREKLKACKDL
ncbi:glycosyltransferase family 8 protein [Amylostereum chailletii]|nr:glycosyltransferase family 8 protein [Amylostereum chailletii]